MPPLRKLDLRTAGSNVRYPFNSSTRMYELVSLKTTFRIDKL